MLNFNLDSVQSAENSFVFAKNIMMIWILISCTEEPWLTGAAYLE